MPLAPPPRGWLALFELMRFPGDIAEVVHWRDHVCQQATGETKEHQELG